MPRSLRSAILCILIASIGACSKDSSTPTAPTAPGATRVIGLDGSLDFGSVQIGAYVDRTLTIVNTGNSTLTVSGITVSIASGGTGFVMNWASGAIAAGASQSVTVRLTPTEAKSYDGMLTVTADYTSGTNTRVISGLGVAPSPPTTFGPGTYTVNTEIASGRYFSAAAFGCSWERLSGLGGTVAETIATEFVGESPGQWIVDVLPSDRYFRANSACGTWVRDAPLRGVQLTIPPGMWLVGAQVIPGTYSSTVGSGCYWERLSGFGSKGTEELIDSKFISTAGPQSVEIKSSDVGFRTNNDCGTWSPASPILAR